MANVEQDKPKKKAGRPAGTKNKATIEREKEAKKIKFFCPKCRKMKREAYFYNTRNTLLKKYPICKPCLVDSIDFYNPNEFVSILKDMNLPFIRDLYNVCIYKHPDTLFPNYIRMVNSLPQYKDYTFRDGFNDLEEFRNDEPKYNHDKILSETKQQQIKDVQNTQLNMPNEFVEPNDYENEFDDSNGYVDANNILDYKDQRKVYSKDWMGTYSEWEIGYLEKYLNDLRSDFKIINRNHLDYARKIAKASLAMDKAYDDMVNSKSDSNKYKTMKETFDSLCKSAQFSENQRGANDVGLGDFGSVFDQVEKNIFVYEYEPENKDIYDLLLEQFSNIKKSL